MVSLSRLKAFDELVIASKKRTRGLRFAQRPLWRDHVVGLLRWTPPGFQRGVTHRRHKFEHEILVKHNQFRCSSLCSSPSFCSNQTYDWENVFQKRHGQLNYRNFLALNHWLGSYGAVLITSRHLLGIRTFNYLSLLPKW